MSEKQISKIDSLIKKAIFKMYADSLEDMTNLKKEIQFQIDQLKGDGDVAYFWLIQDLFEILGHNGYKFKFTVNTVDYIKDADEPITKKLSCVLRFSEAERDYICLTDNKVTEEEFETKPHDYVDLQLILP